MFLAQRRKDRLRVRDVKSVQIWVPLRCSGKLLNCLSVEVNIFRSFSPPNVSCVSGIQASLTRFDSLIFGSSKFLLLSQKYCSLQKRLKGLQKIILLFTTSLGLYPRYTLQILLHVQTILTNREDCPFPDFLFRMTKKGHSNWLFRFV